MSANMVGARLRLEGIPSLTRWMMRDTVLVDHRLRRQGIMTMDTVGGLTGELEALMMGMSVIVGGIGDALISKSDEGGSVVKDVAEIAFVSPFLLFAKVSSASLAGKQSVREVKVR